MFILTDGKNYVMENPIKQGFYLQTTYAAKAKGFSYKQARTLLNSKHKSMSWIKSYYMVNQDNGQIKTSKYKGNGGVYIGENDVSFNENIIQLIYNEINSITRLAGWNLEQLKTYEQELNIALSKYDSAESDISHALQEYKEENNGKKPQAHKMAKIGYLLDDVRDKHKHIKKCLRYVRVMEEAITYSYSIEKMKLELNKVSNAEYKGRTEYFQKAIDILN